MPLQCSTSGQLHTRESIFDPVDRPGKDIRFRFLDNAAWKKPLLLESRIFRVSKAKLQAELNPYRPPVQSEA